MSYFGTLRLAMAVAKRLNKAEDRDKLIATLTLAISDDGKISPIEWVSIGKRLGAFDVK
tara:strand:+ start:245 stop:421 length:177 start_codon:yes stop_codon:yes gene_type:complete